LSAHRFNEEASWITEGIADVKEGTELLDKYQMGRVLGTGTFSTVRLARRKNDGALFAIKVRAYRVATTATRSGPHSTAGQCYHL